MHADSNPRNPRASASLQISSSSTTTTSLPRWPSKDRDFDHPYGDTNHATFARREMAVIPHGFGRKVLTALMGVNNIVI